MKRSRIVDLLKSEGSGFDVLVKGWVRTKRVSKGLCFVEINDGSCLKNIQAVADESMPKYSIFANLTTGTSVAIMGRLIDSPAKGQKFELQTKDVEIYGKADAGEFPLQKKGHSFEFLREIAHLRPRTNTFGAVFRVRNALAFAIHKFFQERGFLYIHTPIITGNDCEGAGQMFRVTTLDAKSANDSQNASDFSEDFFGKKTALTVSGQLEGELVATALGNIYTFGPTFRAENSNTTRHLSEFWMIEPEMAFATLEDNIAIAEEFLKYIFKYCLENCKEDMEFFDQRIQKGVIANLEGIIKSEFTAITYTEAVDILVKSGEKFEFPVKWGIDMQSEHERYLTEKKFKKPVIVIDFPKEIKAFYMKVNADNKTVRAMDVLVPGIGEIIGGSEREDNYDVLKSRMVELGLNPDEYWWYLDTRKFGSVPHAGFGLGFERTIQFITGMQNIRDVIPFPRTPKSAEF
ncbi:MAG: asparagine--tRNA ligase [Spirochaetes bacterium]|nr:asparagine--tRNA ligase [Spirochaetota bacterium]